MEWFIALIAVTAALYFYKKATGDRDLDKVRGVTYLIEKYGARLNAADQHRFNSIVNVTTLLRAGIHALRSGQAFILTDEVIKTFKEISENEQALSMLGIGQHKKYELRAAFKNCYERLRIMHGDARQFDRGLMANSEKSRAEELYDLSDLYPLGAIFTSNKPDACPKCNSNKVAVIHYGLPPDDSPLWEDKEKGKIVFGGCVINGSEAEWQCVECNTQIFRALPA